MEQVDSLLHHHLSHVIARSIEFPPNVIPTVVRVKTSNDLAQCKVWISVMPSDYSHDGLQRIIRANRIISHEISSCIQLKKIPHFIFLEDTTGEKALEMEELLDDLNNGRGGA